MIWKVVRLLIIVFLFSDHLFASIRILTFHCNHSEFLEYQCKALEKFLLNEYELIVMNDGVNEKEQKAIKEVCERYGATNVFYEQSWHVTNRLNEQIRTALSTSMGNDFFSLSTKGRISRYSKNL